MKVVRLTRSTGTRITRGVKLLVALAVLLISHKTVQPDGDSIDASRSGRPGQGTPFSDYGLLSFMSHRFILLQEALLGVKRIEHSAQYPYVL